MESTETFSGPNSGLHKASTVQLSSGSWAKLRTGLHGGMEHPGSVCPPDSGTLQIRQKKKEERKK